MIGQHNDHSYFDTFPQISHRCILSIGKKIDKLYKHVTNCVNNGVFLYSFSMLLVFAVLNINVPKVVIAEEWQ